MNELTREQKQAVFHKEGPACVIAGAGTGKTSVLIERIVFLVENQKIPPEQIVVTTFTRKATAELYSRTFERLGKKAQQLRISTIDALIWELAQMAMDKGEIPFARLIGEAEQRVLLLDCAWEIWGCKSFDLKKKWSNLVERQGLLEKFERYILSELEENNENRHNQITENEIDFRQIAKRYFERLQELSATDYTKISRDFLNYLEKNSRENFSPPIETVLVDEFQDTSRIQAKILLLLSGQKKNIWVVGDPCQQIYEWRGTGKENMEWFITTTKAKKYTLTENWRSTQKILDTAYHFLSRKIPSLKESDLLKHLKSMRDLSFSQHQRYYSVYSGQLEEALIFIKKLLEENPELKPQNVAILSKNLTKQIRIEIETSAIQNGLKVQFQSSRADHVLEQTIRFIPSWEPGHALKKLYNLQKIKRLISQSLVNKDFWELRRVRALATACEALDSTLPHNGLSFSEAWPALKITQDREISISPAILPASDAIQVMTIHAAKGLEFSVVLLLLKGFKFTEEEECRLAYVGLTRARDILILGLSKTNKRIIKDFNSEINAITIGKPQLELPLFPSVQIIPVKNSSLSPLIAATHLDLYEECPLKFAAYHEGRFLPKWTREQSAGARMHKAIEYYLRANLPSDKEIIEKCFAQGFRDGDSPLRKLPPALIEKMKKSYKEITRILVENSKRVIAIEQPYRYLHDHENSGQIEGIIDAVIEDREGRIVLNEWKTSSEIPYEKLKSYTLQVGTGVLGFERLKTAKIDLIEIIPVFAPSQRIQFRRDNNFVELTIQKLDNIFQNLRKRTYRSNKGTHCKFCPLKSQCPGWKR